MFLVHNVTWLDKLASLSLLPRKWLRGPLKLYQISIKLRGTISQKVVNLFDGQPQEWNHFTYYSADMRDDILNFLSVKPDPE